MQERTRFIAPQRVGMWVMVALGTAAVAVLLALVGIREGRTLAVVSQTEVIKLDERLRALESHAHATPAPAPAPAPAAPQQ